MHTSWLTPDPFCRFGMCPFLHQQFHIRRQNFIPKSGLLHLKQGAAKVVMREKEPTHIHTVRPQQPSVISAARNAFIVMHFCCCWSVQTLQYPEPLRSRCHSHLMFNLNDSELVNWSSTTNIKELRDMLKRSLPFTSKGSSFYSDVLGMKIQDHINVCWAFYRSQKAMIGNEQGRRKRLGLFSKPTFEPVLAASSPRLALCWRRRHTQSATTCCIQATQTLNPCWHTTLLNFSTLQCLRQLFILGPTICWLNE